MALISCFPFGSVSPITHVFPKSGVDSIRKFHPFPSMLDGNNKFPFANNSGLFLIGPKNPSGNFSASDHVSPPSEERFNIPHHEDGCGPTL